VLVSNPVCRNQKTKVTGSSPVLTTMNRAVELITQRKADNGDERPIYSFYGQVAIGCHSYIGGCITLPVMGSTGSNPVLTTLEVWEIP